MVGSSFNIIINGHCFTVLFEAEGPQKYRITDIAAISNSMDGKSSLKFDLDVAIFRYDFPLMYNEMLEKTKDEVVNRVYSYLKKVA